MKHAVQDSHPVCTSTARLGSAYVMVLACAVIVSAIGVAGLALTRAQRTAYTFQDDARRATIAATSGLETLTHVLNGSVASRTQLVNGDPILDGLYADASYRIEASDAGDGSLIDDVTDPIDILVFAHVGRAQQIIAATLDPAIVPMSCASYGVAVSGNVVIDEAMLQSTKGLHSALNVIASDSFIDAAVTSAQGTSGSIYLSTTTLSPAAIFPVGADVAALIASATRITHASIPGGNLSNCVLSPTSNPFGIAINQNGIYLVDCNNATINISNMRLVGTLIILNPGSASRVSGSINASPVNSRLPTILWVGNLDLRTSLDDLAESVAGLNLNPVGTPYLGSVDNDTLDTYPALITGTFIVLGDADINGDIAIDGRLIINGSLSMENSRLFNRDEPSSPVVDVLTAPDGMRIRAESVRRAVE